MPNKKTTCAQCRYYLAIDDTKGFCGNIRINKTIRSAAHACGQYTPDGDGTPPKPQTNP